MRDFSAIHILCHAYTFCRGVRSGSSCKQSHSKAPYLALIKTSSSCMELKRKAESNVKDADVIC